MIPERTLRKWRIQALVEVPDWEEANADFVRALQDRILRMTQILLDQHLIRKEKKE